MNKAEQIRTTTCPTCGSDVKQTTGNSTNHFIPIDKKSHAIEFAEWVKSRYVYTGVVWLSLDDDDRNEFTTEQLYNIFNEIK